MKNLRIFFDGHNRSPGRFPGRAPARGITENAGRRSRRQSGKKSSSVSTGWRIRAQGCYALIDYVNFKGEGILETERYKGRGWGLMQALAGMTGNQEGAAPDEFAEAAASVLRERVENSPPDRHERRWLAGWLNRVATYRK